MYYSNSTGDWQGSNLDEGDSWYYNDDGRFEFWDNKGNHWKNDIEGVQYYYQHDGDYAIKYINGD